MDAARSVRAGEDSVSQPDWLRYAATAFGLHRKAPTNTTAPASAGSRPALAALIGVIDAPPPEVIRRILAYRNEVAHELAGQQRREMRAPGQSYDASRWNRAVDMTADSIEPESTR